MKNENLVFQCLLKKLDLNPNVIDYQIRFFFNILGYDVNFGCDGLKFELIKKWFLFYILFYFLLFNLLVFYFCV